MFKKCVLAMAAMLLGATGTASAATIFSTSTAPGCGNCYGLTYTLTVGDAGDLVATTYDATLNVTGTLSAAGTAAGVTHISAVDFKVANNVISPVLTAAPTALAGWTTVEASSNNSGCGGGGNGFVCSEAISPAFFAPVTGSPVNLTWAWTFSLAAGVTPTPKHIGAKLNNAAGTLNGQVVSENVSVPDGGMTLSLLGLALAGMGLMRRRLS